MRNCSQGRKYWGFCYLPLFFLFVGTTVIFSVILFLRIRKNSTFSNEEYEYNFMRHDPFSNRSNFGFITINKLLDGYLSFTNLDGSESLISPITEIQYVCSGSCFCVDERRSVTLLHRSSFILLVSAITTIIAMDRAKLSLKEKCSDEFLSCSRKSFRTEVDYCETFGSWDEVEEDLEEDIIEFVCRGKCKVNPKLKKSGVSNEVRDISLSVRCTDLKTTKILTFDCYGLDDLSCRKQVQQTFHSSYLDGFCRRNSKRTLQGYKKNWCVGGNKSCKQSIKHTKSTLDDLD